MAIFIAFFLIVFFIPYLRSSPAPDAGNLIVPGRYPLIFIFLASLVVIIDIFTGTIVLRDWLFFGSFIVGIMVMYLCVCVLSGLLFRMKKIIRPENKNVNEQICNQDKYVLNLDKQLKND